MRKEKRDMIRLLEPLGFEYKGTNGSGHEVFVSEDTGLPLIVAKTPSDRRSVANTVTQAKRAKSQGDSVSRHFVRFIMEQLGIAEDEQRVKIAVHVAEMKRRFRIAFPAEARSVQDGTFDMAISQSPFIERHGNINRGSVTKARSILTITGPLYGLETEPEHGVVAVEGESPIPGPYMEAEGAGKRERPIVPVKVIYREAPPEQVLAPEPILAKTPESADEMINSLRHLLAGDVEAERDLLRDAVGEAYESLREAAKAITHAQHLLDSARDLSASAVPEVKKPREKREGEKFGELRTSRMRKIREGIRRGDLNARFHYPDAARMLGITDNAMSTTLAAAVLHPEQGVERVARGIYEVRV